MNQCCIYVLLVAFGCRFFVTNTRAVVLSVCIGIGGCLCPIYSTVFLDGMAWRELTKSAPISASAAEVITFLMIWAMLSTAPLFGGFSEWSDRKKCPPARLLAFGSER